MIFTFVGVLVLAVPFAIAFPRLVERDIRRAEERRRMERSRRLYLVLSSSQARFVAEMEKATKALNRFGKEIQKAMAARQP